MRHQSLNFQDGLSIRPARTSDNPFLESLYNSTRDDLRLIDAENDFIETLIEQQHHAQTVGYGDQFPNAFYFIVEKQHGRIGRVVVDFGQNEVRLVDVAFIPAARGKGYGHHVVRAMQNAAAQVRAPLTLSVSSANPGAKRFYLSMGFRVEQYTTMSELMAWYPAPSMLVSGV